MVRLIPRNPFPHPFSELARACIPRIPDPAPIERFLELTGRDHGFFTQSARKAFFLILNSLLRAGDEIILPAFTCNVLVGPLLKSNVTPIFADVSRTSLNMELKHLECLVTDRTRAVVMTHQFGFPADAAAIVDFCRRKELLLIEDAAPALGVSVQGRPTGSWGDVAIFSFERSKVASMLHGGLLVGREDLVRKIKSRTRLSQKRSSFAEVCRAFFQHCALNDLFYRQTFLIWRLWNKNISLANQWQPDLDDYILEHDGLSDFQKRLGGAQLSRLGQILQTRREAAVMFSEVFSDFASCTVPQTSGPAQAHSYSRFPVLLQNADGRAFDKRYVHQIGVRHGIDLGFTFSYKMSSYFPHTRGQNFKNTDWIIERIYNVPIHPNPEINHRTARSLRTICSELFS